MGCTGRSGRCGCGSISPFSCEQCCASCCSHLCLVRISMLASDYVRFWLIVWREFSFVCFNSALSPSSLLLCLAPSVPSAFFFWRRFARFSLSLFQELLPISFRCTVFGEFNSKKFVTQFPPPPISSSAGDTPVTECLVTLYWERKF